tara:strand:+ start:61 stop:456 length:396 start_codon:yes stop_codon:yes gene_type:complete
MNLRQQLVKKGKPVDNDIDFSGNRTSDFTNKFLAKMKDTNNLFQTESPGSFTDPEADVVRRNLIKTSDGQPQFDDPVKQIKANAFLAKYNNSIVIPPGEKTNVDTVLQYVMGDPNSAPVNGQFPTDGVKVS